MQINPAAFNLITRTQAIVNHEPVWTEVSTAIMGSVQTDSRETRVTAQGYQGQERKRFNSTTRIAEVDNVGAVPTMLIEYDSVRWVVWDVNPPRGLPGLPGHYVAWAYKQQPIRPDAGSF